MCLKVVCRQCICGISTEAPFEALKEPLCQSCYAFDAITKQKNGDRHEKNPALLKDNPRCAICGSGQQMSLCFARTCTTAIFGSLCQKHTKACDKCKMPFCPLHVGNHACSTSTVQVEVKAEEPQSQQSLKRARRKAAKRKAEEAASELTEKDEPPASKFKFETVKVEGSEEDTDRKVEDKKFDINDPLGISDDPLGLFLETPGDLDARCTGTCTLCNANECHYPEAHHMNDGTDCRCHESTYRDCTLPRPPPGPPPVRPVKPLPHIDVLPLGAYLDGDQRGEGSSVREIPEDERGQNLSPTSEVRSECSETPVASAYLGGPSPTEE